MLHDDSGLGLFPSPLLSRFRCPAAHVCQSVLRTSISVRLRPLIIYLGG
jgi:hypothetical protein